MSEPLHQTKENPLLSSAPLPRFDLITPEHVVPAMQHLLATLDAELQQLESQVQPTWESLVEPIERLSDRLSVVWGIVGHLMGVKNNEALRQAHHTVQPEVVQFSLRFGQSPALYQGLKSLQASGTWQTLDATQQRIVEKLIEDAELSGVGLHGEKRQRFNAIQQELAELSTQFSNHVLDATKAFGLTLTTQEDVAGLPASLLSLAAQAAREAGASGATPEHGPWRITLDFPSFAPFLEHSQRRDLRETLYRAFISRASTGPEDNTPLINRILQLRQEKRCFSGIAPMPNSVWPVRWPPM